MTEWLGETVNIAAASPLEEEMDAQSALAASSRPNAALNALRWIAALPLAAAASFVASIVVTLVNRITMFLGGMNPDAPLDKFFVTLLSAGASGAAFVYVGTRLAPRHKTTVSIVLATLMVFGMGILFLPVIASRNWWGILSLVGTVAGSVILAYSVFAEGMDVGRES